MGCPVGPGVGFTVGTAVGASSHEYATLVTPVNHVLSPVEYRWLPTRPPTLVAPMVPPVTHDKRPPAPTVDSVSPGTSPEVVLAR